MSGVRRFRGGSQFRQRIALATLSGKAIRIDDIRHREETPGLRDFEANFLRLIEKLTNGCRIEINETGTSLYYRPGVLAFGHPGDLVHDCGNSRSIGYFLEGIVALAPFGKRALHIKLRGITNDERDQSVDGFRNVTLRLMQKFGLDEAGLELKVLKRGAPPRGGGEVLFRCPSTRELKPIDITDEGFVKRIRGVAYATRVSPSMSNRIVDSSRSLLNKFIPDVYIYTDHYRGPDSGNCPGYGLSLVAETTTGCSLSAEVMAEVPSTEMKAGQRSGQHASEEATTEAERRSPENIGLRAAKLLLQVSSPTNVLTPPSPPPSTTNYNLTTLQPYNLTTLLP
jgi:RNA 3'-terminal phosphate cyclase-like protein